jgi:hypothetical protein
LERCEAAQLDWKLPTEHVIPHLQISERCEVSE